MTFDEAKKCLNDNTIKRNHFNRAITLICWDLETQTPAKGVVRHSEAIGFFSEKLYKIFTSKEYRHALEVLNTSRENLTEIEKRIVTLSIKNSDKTAKIPQHEYVEFSELTALAQSVWAEAREKNDFSIFAHTLEKIIEFQRKFISYFGFEGHPYNALVCEYEEGMSVEKLDDFFNTLKQEIVPLIARISKEPQINTEALHQKFDVDTQKKFSKWLAEYLHFDFERGLLAESVHPFTLHFDKNDVRITSRYHAELLLSSIFSTIHESGHALYDQNMGDDILGTLLSEETSYGIHESQSRFFENLIGKNILFWKKVYPKLQESFKAELSDISLENFYRMMNIVEPSLIRVEADELTYPLHIVIRYEVEKTIFENPSLSIHDLPKLWNSKYKEYLGIDVQSDSEGILQDVHWSGGSFGYFPTYALGTAYASHILYHMRKTLDFDTLLEKGDLRPILNYLTQNIHQYGGLKTPSELIFNLGQEDFNPKYFTDYLKEKFSKIYNL
ncbi:MAG: carboxypeptidase M32 [Fusobacteria bacterium]|nr:carboxypeptidase M32 [Fusobacteriota bacterium]